MFIPKSLIPGVIIHNVRKDLRGAERIEQYRLGREAVYIPEGLKWTYIPRAAIQSASPSHRTISAGHCVTIEVKTPSLEIVTAEDRFALHLEKQASLDRFLEVLHEEG